MIRRAASFLTVLLFAVPISTGALGLGDIVLSSALNEPIDARIPLRSVQPGDAEGMKVALGSAEQFRRADVERPFLLSQLRFRIVEETDGSFYIHVTTSQPVSEPFLNFLIDVDWSRGRFVREYTLLLDPPVYGAAIRATVKESVVVSQAPPPARPLEAAGAAPRQGGGAAATSASIAGWNPPGTTYGPTTSTDTLWSLADRFRGDTAVSMQQMMLAMLRINPDAFSQNNVNTLKAGVVLLIPTRADVEAMSKSDALAEVRRHHAAWEEIRRSLTATARPAPQGTVAAGVPAGPGGATIAGSAGTDDAALKLVGSGTAAGGAGSTTEAPAGGASASDQVNLALEEADRRRRENEELKSKLSAAEDLVGDLQRLVQVQSDDIAALQKRLAEQEAALQAEPAPAPSETPVAAAAPTPTPTPAPAAPAPPPAPPVAAKPPVPLPPPGPTSALDIVLGQLEGLPGGAAGVGGAVGGVIVLVILGVVVARRRRRAATGAPAEEVSFGSEDETELPMADPVGEEPTTVAPADEPPDIADDVTEVPAAATEAKGDEAPAARAAGGEDPLAEVNVYLAYERFDQAESLVKAAIEAHPDRHEYKVKLLEVFHTAKDAVGFEAAAKTLHEAVGDESPLMEKAQAWWRELSPDRSLFEEGAGDFTETKVGLDTEAPIFDVTGGDGSAVAPAGDGEAAVGEDTAGSIDFDLGLDFDTGEAEGEAVGEGTTVDFNVVTDGDEAEAAAGTGTGTELDFDLGEEPKEAVGAGTGLDFDLGDTGLEAPGEPAPGAESGLDFDLGEAAPEAPPAAGAASDTGLDFDLDFATDSEPEAAAPEAGADLPAGEAVDGALDFAPEEEPAATAPEADDLVLDFDLGDAGAEASTAEAAAEPVPPDDVTGPGGEAAGLGEAAAPESGEEDAGLDLDLDLDFALDAEDDDAIEIPEIPEIQPDEGGEDEPAGMGLLEETVTSLQSPPLPEPAGDEAGGESSVSPDEETIELGEIGLVGDEPAGVDPGSLEVDTEFAGIFESDDSAAEAPGEGTDEVTNLNLEVPLEGPALDLEPIGVDAEPGPDSTPEVDGDFADIFGDSPAPAAGTDAEAIDEITDLNPDIAASLESPPPEGEESGLDLVLEAPDDAADATAAGESGGLDLDLGEPDGGAAAGADTGAVDLDFGDLEIELPETGADEEDRTLVLGRGPSGEVDEVQTKLDLAQAYVDMGDAEGARNILGEVMAEGNDAQRDEAEALLKKLS